jgi:hypothetical protein
MPRIGIRFFAQGWLFPRLRVLDLPSQNDDSVGTGDCNNDGNIDILWRYNGTGGYVYIWCLERANWIGGEDLLPVADLTWEIVSR